jgi:hypothetical protein
MKKSDVPQDQAAALEGQRKAMYAVDANGRYTIIPSSGWEAEEIVLENAIEHFSILRETARGRVRAGLASALEFHMYACRMDMTLLAQSTGLFKWRVRRHLKPTVFNRLSVDVLETYAEALGLTVAQLKRLPDEPGGRT